MHPEGAHPRTMRVRTCIPQGCASMTSVGAHLRGLGMGDFAFGDGGLCPWGWGTLLVGMVATAMASRAYMATARLLLVIPFPDQSLHLAQIETIGGSRNRGMAI